MIDSHAHLTDRRYNDVAAIIERYLAAGGEILVDIGYDEATSKGARDNSKKFDCVYFTCGFHPSEEAKDNDLSVLRTLSRSEKCVAIGEIGLDYHYENVIKARQEDLFVRQLFIAHEEKLPVVIHSRDASGDMLRILKEHKDLLSDGFLMHCYSESAEQAKNYLDLGAYFAFGGTITFKNAKKEDVVRSIPLDRLLAETDSPYLAPEPKRGTLNEPENVRFVYKKLSVITGVSFEELERITRDNFLRLFKKIVL